MSIYQEIAQLLRGNLELICQPHADELVFYHDNNHTSWKAVLLLREDEDGDVFVHMGAAFLHGEQEILCPASIKLYESIQRQQQEMEFGTVLVTSEEGRIAVNLRRVWYLTESPEEELSEQVQQQFVDEVGLFSQEAMVLLDFMWLHSQGGLETNEAVDFLFCDTQGEA